MISLKHNHRRKSLIILLSVVLGFSACKKAENIKAGPQASFSTNIVLGSEPKESEAIQLNNTSSGENTYLWDFGNGTTSTEKNPSVSYKIHGTYTVTLTVTNSEGLRSTTSLEVTILCRFKDNNHMAAVPL